MTPRSNITAYPLAWPLGYPRAKSKSTSRFSTSLAGARDGLLEELRLLGVSADADEEAIRRAYRLRAMETHPDRGGSKEAFQQVQEALHQGLSARREGQPA